MRHEEERTDALKSAAASMTTGDIKALMAAARPVLETWTAADVRHHEFAPVLVRTDADGVERLDHGAFVEDAGGGYRWRSAAQQCRARSKLTCIARVVSNVRTGWRTINVGARGASALC